MFSTLSKKILSLIFFLISVLHNFAIDISFSIVCLQLFFLKISNISPNITILACSFFGVLFVYNFDQFLDAYKQRKIKKYKSRLIFLTSSFLIAICLLFYLIRSEFYFLQYYKLLLFCVILIGLYFVILLGSKSFLFKEMLVGILFSFFIWTFTLIQIENKKEFEDIIKTSSFQLTYLHFSLLLLFISYLFSFFHTSKDKKNEQKSIMLIFSKKIILSFFNLYILALIILTICIKPYIDFFYFHYSLSLIFFYSTLYLAYFLVKSNLLKSRIKTLDLKITTFICFLGDMGFAIFYFYLMCV